MQRLLTISVLSIALTGCTKPHPVETVPPGSQDLTEDNSPVTGSSDLPVDVDLPLQDKPSLMALAKVATQLGGKVRRFTGPIAPSANPSTPPIASNTGNSPAPPEYVELNFQGKKLTDAEMERLSAEPGFQEVTTVNLGHARISDESLQYLAKASHMSYLDLTNTPVTDQGLRHLMGHPSLGYIVIDQKVDGSGITRQASEQLIQSLPALQR